MKNNTPQNTESIYINPKAAIAVLVTFVLLVGCLIPMFVGLAMDAFGGGDVEVSDGGSKSNKDKTTQGEKDKPVSVTSKAGEKTGIMLPCITKEGTYLSVSNERTRDISGDTAIKSEAAVLVDITDNVTVVGKNADIRIYPASMTKVMTLLVACENVKNPNELLTLTSEMMDKYNKVKGTDTQGPSLELVWQEGYQVTVEDAMYMVIYGSDTYACWLLADYISGSEEKFVKLMNSKAEKLGFTGTNYTNCTGLFDVNHYTTCREMAAVMAAAMNNETAKTILTSISEYYIDVYIDGEKDEDASAAMWSNWYAGRVQRYPYESSNGKKAYIYTGNGSNVKFIGGKTGYETVPKSSFVTVGEDDTTKRMYVCVQVSRLDDTTRKELKIADAIKESTMETRYIYYTYAKEPE